MKNFQKIDILGKIKEKDRLLYEINVPCASRRSILCRYSLTRLKKKKKKKMIFMKLTKKLIQLKRDQRWAGGKKRGRKKETKEIRERGMKRKIDS